MARLTEKQKRFVAEYLVDLNATRAAERAGYKDPNIGRQLITKNNVSSAIQESMEKRSRRTEITQDWVLEELRKVAASNGSVYAQVVTKERPETVLDQETGVFKQVSKVSQFVELTDTGELTDDQKAAISSIEETKFGIKVSTYDKVRALELIGKHLGLFDGKGGQVADKENNLLQAIADSAQEDLNTDDLPETE